LNSALTTAPDIAEQQMLISWIDRLTDWHLNILALFDDRGDGVILG
jgi:hypothetical protein